MQTFTVFTANLFITFRNYEIFLASAAQKWIEGKLWQLPCGALVLNPINLSIRAAPSLSRNSWLTVLSTFQSVQGRYFCHWKWMLQVQLPVWWQQGGKDVFVRNHIFQITHWASKYSLGLSALLETEAMNTASLWLLSPCQRGFQCWSMLEWIKWNFYPENTTIHFSHVFLYIHTWAAAGSWLLLTDSKAILYLRR